MSTGLPVPNHRWIAVGSGLAGLAVALGAFGAHALREMVPEARIATWQTAVLYHLVHSVALILVGLCGGPVAAFRLFLAGMTLFSGTLYAYVLTGTMLGPIPPVGGLCLMAGWVWFAVASLQNAGKD